jgi:tripartite-type tricarboxylate transporter receptor subunit TctC
VRIISSVIAAATIAAGLAAPPLPVLAQGSAQAYPSRPIHLIVNFAPGGAGDILGRIIGNQLGIELHPVLGDVLCVHAELWFIRCDVAATTEHDA